MLLAASMGVQAQTVYTLSDCRRLATQHNKQLKVAAEQVESARNLEKAALTQFLPSVSATGAYLHNQKNVSLLGEDAYLPVYTMGANGSPSFYQSVNNNWYYQNGIPVAPLDENNQPFNPSLNPEKIKWKNMAFLPKNAFSLDMSNVYAGNIMLTQPLFLGGKIIALNELAKSAKRLAEAGLEGKRAETLLETDIAYWRIVSLVNKEKLAIGYLELLNKLSADMEKSIAIGVATKADHLTIKVKQNEAEMLLLQVQDGLKLSRMALNQLCGLPLDAVSQLADEQLQSLNQPELSPLVEQPTTNRSEIRSLEEGVKMAEANKRIMVSRFLPNAAMTAGYLTSNPSMYNGYEKKFNGQFQVGVVVNVPIFHWGERIQTLRSAEHEKNAIQYQLEEAKEKIELDVTQSRFKLDEAARKLEMTTSNKEKAQENLTCANLGYESGVIAPSTVLEAQTAWLKANSEQIDAQIDAQLCRVYLQKALGQLNQ